tara:strand:- start:150 stop:503 length:354 start_codon:yes stop_codon:yes gene_type:complete
MKTKLVALFAITLGLATASGTPEKEEGRKDRSKPGIKQWIEKFDKNKDGKLDEAERKVAAAARKKMLLQKFDKDGDGKLNSEERKAAIAATAAMKKRKGGPKPKGKGKGKGKKPAKK